MNTSCTGPASVSTTPPLFEVAQVIQNLKSGEVRFKKLIAWLVLQGLQHKLPAVAFTHWYSNSLSPTTGDRKFALALTDFFEHQLDAINGAIAVADVRVVFSLTGGYVRTPRGDGKWDSLLNYSPLTCWVVRSVAATKRLPPVSDDQVKLLIIPEPSEIEQLINETWQRAA